MELFMEDRALKPSLRRELSLTKSTHHVFLDEFWCLAENNGVSGEEFSVDDLFDFSNGEFEEKHSVSVSSGQDLAVDDDSNSNFSHLSTAGDSQFLLAGQLAVPVDDMAELEWVSRFVDDSVSDFSLSYDAVKERTNSYTETRSEPEPRPAVTRPPCFPSPVPCKSRTKRPRTTGRRWLSSPFSDSSSSSSSSSSASCLSFTEPGPAKRKTKYPVQTGDMSGLVQFQRRCSHCQVQKTPQWRTGPLGAKTLCNACGVRFKSGRLFPEYRPACSPTFSDDVHSNSHRKVLEMRKKKDLVGPESGLTRTVSSF